VRELLARLGNMHFSAAYTTVKLELDIIDLSYDKCTDGVQQLVQRGAHVVLGSSISSCTVRMSPTANEYGLPMVGFSETSAALSNKTVHPNFFRVLSNDDWQGLALSKLCLRYGLTSVAILSSTVSDIGVCVVCHVTIVLIQSCTGHLWTWPGSQISRGLAQRRRHCCKMATVYPKRP
jgi:hypothetical protein